ncbi:PQQ-dependent sugar dehydrogenase [Altererythrobacter xixiisoli]|uniref:PQQ-dependent sugar dehydrogenase n=1 Tax=Croceibacterium xixiisoli TaxID=1476466 RepID=A0A6I4TWX3_9SPHN|nr:PQQ-dependent sugar dehydrogenase [Croceibacterium xixiisoli]MXP00495.1 PQQ-dependent sugar dehydrogenase [Croceibacterium xixiisoli]
MRERANSAWRALIGGMLTTGLFALPASAQDAAPAPTAAPAALPPDGPRPPVALGIGPWRYDSSAGPIDVKVITRQLDHPWALAFLPDGSTLVTERSGRLRIIRNGTLDPVAIAGLPPINPTSIGGLYDIAIDPDFANNRRIYLSYVKPDPQNHDQTTVAVMSAIYDGGMALSDVKDIFVADAWFGARPWPARCCGQGPGWGSWGGRILFGPDGKLFITVGDRNYGEMAQQPDGDFGKILRINPDGSIPADNPFVGQPGWNPQIWTLGHRNPLGLAFHPQTGQLWESEFGPRGGDELNIIEKGQNYGWISVTQGQHYDGTPAQGIREVAGMTDPVIAFGPPSVNPGDLAWYDGAMFPAWQGSLFMPSFTEGLMRITLDAAGKANVAEHLIEDLKQRLRAVSVAPDGSLYVITDEERGTVLRISKRP